MCLKTAFRKMYPTFGGRSAPDRGVIAGYVDEIRGRSPAKWGMQIAGMSFQTRSRKLSNDEIHYSIYQMTNCKN